LIKRHFGLVLSDHVEDVAEDSRDGLGAAETHEEQNIFSE
jgi:hypothetical protein